jgi:alpha-L-rhamnosidase
MLKLYDLSINAAKNPAFAPCKDLYIGWKLDSDNTGVLQTAYKAAITKVGYETPAWTDEGSTKSVHIPVDAVLESRTDYILTVTATDNHGETATAHLRFATAMKPEDWQGKWIKPKKLMMGWAPYLRTKFEVQSGVASAKLYVCGLGCGEYYINNQKISEDLIDPPMTNYEREVFYRAYDVTSFIKEGKNAFAALLGEGFYAQSRVWSHTGFYYGDSCLMAQLELTFEDGTKTVLATDTDGSWSYKYSPIVLNNVYGGETYDTRLETPDFADPNGDEEEWGSVVEDTVPKGELKLCMMPPVRVIRTLPALSVN